MNRRFTSCLAALILCASAALAGVSTNLNYYLEYIESTGSQWLDTGVKGKSTINIAADVKVLSNKGSSGIIGEREGGKRLVFFVNSSGQPAINFASLDSGWKSGSILNTRCVISNDNCNLYVDGVAKYTNTRQTFTSSLTMTMFFYRSSATAVDKGGTRPLCAQVYGLKIYDDGTLVRDFRPCIATITDTDAGTSVTRPGLWDAVEGRFYHDLSGEATDFTAGPVLASSLTVEGDPYDVGVVSPPYGLHAQAMIIGTATNCSAPASVSADGFSAVCAGYRFYLMTPGESEWTLASSGAGNSFSYTPSAANARVVWLWNVVADLAVALGGAPSATQNSFCIPAVVSGLGASGAPATLKAAYGYSADALLFTNALATVSAMGATNVTLPRLQPGTPYFVRLLLESSAPGDGVAESDVFCAQTAGVEEFGYLPGLWQTFFTSANNAWTLDVLSLPVGTDWLQYTDADRIRRRELTPIGAYVGGNPGATKYTSEVWGDKVYWPVNGGQWAYVGYIYLESSKSYKFRMYIDDNERIQITDAETGATTTLLEDTASKKEVKTSAAYKPSATGWHTIEIRMSDGSGGAGGYDTSSGYLNSNNLGFSRDGGSTWGLLKDTGDGSLLRVRTDFAITATEVVANGGLASVSLDFPAGDADDRALRVVWGPEHGGDEPSGWAYGAAVATIPAADTHYTWPVPADWGSASNLVVRFYFDGTYPEWSNSIFWRDCSNPFVTGVALDGAGGDTLAVSGTLASFGGADCALSVFVGDSPAALTNAWTGLAGSTKSAPGAFALTLFEADAASPRYLAPGATYYVAVEAVSDGRAFRTAPQPVTMKAAPVFGNTASAVVRRTVTFSGGLADIGMGEAATVTLYAGAASDADNALVVAEPPLVVSNTAAFAITHTFPAFETDYKWQLRAVVTAVGGTSTLETRTSAAVVHTLDTTTYTWAGGASGNWSSAANWTDNQSRDSLGYPQSSAATAVFPASTVADIALTEALTVGTVNLSAAGLDVTFSQGGASTNATKLTTGTLNLNGARGAVTLDNVAIASSAHITLGERRALSLVNGANLYTTGYLHNQVSNTVLIAADSFLSCDWMYFGGGSLTISNATLWTRGHNYVGANRTGGRVLIAGEHPFWYHAGPSAYFCSTLANANVQIDFLVPAGGFATAPIRAISTVKSYMGNNGNNAGACPLTVNVLDESPANFADATVTSPLIDWPKGINTNGQMVVGGHLPQDNGATTDDAFVWGEGAYPPSLSVTIRGTSHAGELLVTGAPMDVDSSSLVPALGYSALSQGTPRNCSAPADYVQISPETRALCVGWKLYDVDPATLARTLAASDTNTSCTVVGNGGWRQLEWQWRIEHLVVASAGAGGSVSPASQWVAVGDNATIVATPDGSHGFYKWTGDVPASCAAVDETLHFEVSGPATVAATFGGVYYVSPGGDASAPTQGYATGFRTIQAALAVARDGDTVKVSPGDYALEDAVSVTHGVKVVGAGPEETALYKTGSAEVSYRLVYINHPEAVLRGLSITNGLAKSTTGSGVYIDTAGGRVENCHIAKNRGVFVMSAAGVISRCVLEANTGSYSYPVYVKDGLIENCLLSRNTVTAGNTPGAGLRLEGSATARNCTVVRNTSTSTTIGGVYCAAATVRVINCAMYDNSATSSTAPGWPDWYGDGDCFVNCAAPVAPNATCRGGDGGFLDAASGNYRLRVDSSLRNAGAEVAGIGVLDLDGGARISGEAIDIGCYEYDESATDVGLSVSPESLFTGGTAVFAPAIVGIPADAPRTWTITDEHGVATVLPASCENGITLSQPGLYTVRLDVSSGGRTYTAERPAYLYVGPRTIYVDSASATPRSPFATAATAATDVNAAVGYAGLVAGTEVLVADGDYTLTNELALSCAMTLHSVNGATNTVLRRVGALESGPRFRILYLNDPNARVSGFTVTGGSSEKNGGGAYIDVLGGEIADCVISNNFSSPWGASGAGVFMNSSAAHVDRCVLTCNTNKNNGSTCRGAGACVQGGLLENCLVTHNWTKHHGAGVYVSGSGKVYNCTIYGNTSTDGVGGGICGNGGSVTVRNTVACGNTAPQDATVGGPDVSYDNGANFARYFNCAFPKAVGTLAAVEDPAFADPANGDFTLQASSALRNGGDVVADLGAFDLAGAPRQSEGSAPDIGCYEYDETQRSIAFTASPTILFAGSAIALSPTIEGYGAGATHAWTLTDEQGRETTVSAAEESSFAVAAAGLYSVTLTVTDGGADHQAFREDYIRVVNRRYAVSNVVELVSALDCASYIDGVEIDVADGDYVLDDTIRIETATTLRSEGGAGAATFRRVGALESGNRFRVLYVNDPAALVAGFTITGGSVAENCGGVLIGPRGGTLAECVVSNNFASSWGATGAGIYMNSSAAHVDRCLVTCNTNKNSGSVCRGAGVYVGGGLLENSLVTRNWTQHNGAGVFVNGSGKVYNCTIHGNTAVAGVGGGICAGNSAAVIRNTASYGNIAPFDTTAGAPDVAIVDSGSYACYTNCAFPVAVGTLEAIPDPAFTDAEGGDFTLQTGSSLIDAGASPADLGPRDLAGNDRAYGETAPDIGCYEYQPGQVGISFTVSPGVGFYGDTFTFTPSIDGLDGELVKTWTITDASGASTVLGAGCEEGVALNAYGVFDVTLAVTAGGETYTLTRPALFRVAPRELFVDAASANPVAPYVTRATAATNVLDAVAEAVDGSTIHVAPGDYALSGTISLEADIALLSDEGASRTVLRRTFGTAAPAFGIVNINAPGAVVRGFTITGGREGSYGGVRIQSRGGTLEDCVVEGNGSTSSYGYYAGGVAASSAKAYVRRCVIRNNTMACTSGQYGAGAVVNPGRIENCLIVGNGPTATGKCGGGLYLGGAAVAANCTVVSNFSNRVTGGVLFGDANARAVNCAILGNVGPDTADNHDWNAGMREYLTYCATSVRTGEGYVLTTFDEALFRNPAVGDYRPRNRSPLVNAGSDLSYGADDTDLAGNPRIYEKGVNRHAACDIGCYEAAFNPGGGTIIIMR